MADRLEVIDSKKIELQGYIEKIPWRQFIDYGSVKIQVRDGKVTTIAIERTIKLD